MNGIEALLNMLVNLVMQIIVAFARIIMSFADTDAGKQVFGESNYPGAPTTPTPPLTVEALQTFGVDTALKFIIPVVILFVLVPRVFSTPRARKAK